MKKIQLLFLSISILLPFIAHSATLEYSTDFLRDNSNTSTSTTGNSLYDYDQLTSTATLNRFDSSLGTLTNVNISFISDWAHTSNAFASDSTTTSSQVKTGRERTSIIGCGSWGLSACYKDVYSTRYANDTWMNASSTASYQIALVDPSSSSTSINDNNSLSCSQSYSNSTSSRTATCSDTDSSTGGFNGSLDLSSFTLADFISTASNNPLDFIFTNTTSLSGNCDNNDSYDICSGWTNSYWDGSVSVSYEYDKLVTVTTPPSTANAGTSIPEPTSLFLISLGLLGFSIRRINT